MAAGAIPGERTGGEPLRDWMIAVIAGVAGVLLLAIVILALCCFKRRKKARGGKKIVTTLPVLKKLNLHPYLPLLIFNTRLNNSLSLNKENPDRKQQLECIVPENSHTPPPSPQRRLGFPGGRGGSPRRPSK